jgi:4-amino-4-deoxy-L-arabinose transferase-like glycosyltransferase
MLDLRLARTSFAVALALSAALLGFDLGVRVLATNDEARFAMMARDILANGHWLLPEIGGVAMLNKPPLHAWLIAVAAWPTGEVSQRTAVVPSLLGALGLVAVTCWLARRLFGSGAGLAAGLIVATTAGVFALARSALPDMTLSFGIAAAMAAFVSAELDDRRPAWLGFYGLVGVAFWAKGPAGLLPVAVAAAYEVATFGWRGLTRMRVGVGVAIVALLVGPWWLLAANAGREQFVQDVLRTDMLQGYDPLRAWSWRRVVDPLGAAVTILLPWSLLLPFAVRSAARHWRKQYAGGERLALLWAITVFLFVAASYRQRWRYYLPLCAPGALLVSGWWWTRRISSRMAVFVAVWAVVAGVLVVGETYVTARHNRGTGLRAIAETLELAPAPVFAVDAPELVLSFYLGRPIRAVLDASELGRLAPPIYVIAKKPLGRERLETVTDGFVNGQRFVLLGTRQGPERGRTDHDEARSGDLLRGEPADHHAGDGHARMDPNSWRDRPRRRARFDRRESARAGALGIHARRPCRRPHRLAQGRRVPAHRRHRRRRAGHAPAPE